MDKKECLLFNHYKNRLEKDLFDEYDVLGILILLRPYMDQYKNLLEFAHIIAHRERDRGIGMECITTVQNNDFELVEGTKKVVGFEGISYIKIEEELNSILSEHDINVSNDVLKGVIFCIFSLSQFVEYKNGDITGKMYLMQGNSNTLALCATEGKEHSYFVCFSYMSGVKHNILYDGGLIERPAIVKRVGSKLALYDENTLISSLI